MGQYIINAPYEKVEEIIQKELSAGAIYESYIPTLNGVILVFSSYISSRPRKPAENKAEEEKEIFTKDDFLASLKEDVAETFEDDEIILFGRLRNKPYGSIRGTEEEKSLLEGIKNTPSLRFPSDPVKQAQLEKFRRIIGI